MRAFLIAADRDVQKNHALQFGLMVTAMRGEPAEIKALMRALSE